MNGLTSEQWLNVILADAGLALLAALVLAVLWRLNRKGTGAVIAIALLVPAGVGLKLLTDELHEPADCTLACWSAYEIHWVGWMVGWVIAAPVLLGTAIGAAAREARSMRRRHADARPDGP